MTILKLRRTTFVACLAVSALAGGRATAVEITPAGANYDLWIRESSPGTVYNNDSMSVWAVDSGNQRYGVVQFNISSISQPITSARLELWNRNNGAVTMAPAYWVDSSVQPGDLSTLNWSSYDLFIKPFETEFEALGSGDFPSGTPAQNTYGIAGVATAADAAVLNTIRQGDGIITMIFKATTGKRDWGATDPDASPARLVINEQLPVAGDLNGDFVVDLTDYGILKTNWLQPVSPGTNGDFDGSGVVSLADFVLFKADYQAFNGGGGSALAPVPEPTTFVLLAAALPAWLLFRRRKSK